MRMVDRDTLSTTSSPSSVAEPTRPATCSGRRSLRRRPKTERKRTVGVSNPSHESAGRVPDPMDESRPSLPSGARAERTAASGTNFLGLEKRKIHAGEGSSALQGEPSEGLAGCSVLTLLFD